MICMTNPIENDALERKKRGKRIVDEHTEKDYILNGKKVNKNVWELQQLYESTQAKTTKVLPEFLERIRFMVVKGILKASFNQQVDQKGELFNYVLEDLLKKIVPTKDESTGNLTTKYDSNKANLGSYILNSCYWSVIGYKNKESHYESLVSCGDFMEDYEKVAEEPIDTELDQFKFISSYSESDTYVPVVQKILEGSAND